ncbi:VacJ family lipoprotein [Pseudomonas sp. dw_358]|uniref:MlaA family lipoprotein n=1 Tax=Pseudomonas sp. dw_358 TaxID=2720083 RepID=UPI001BD24514|nr:VacJ family lipoprotein [Pseudomonas sp. dw_358]
MHVFGSGSLYRLARACLFASAVLLPMAAHAADSDPWEGANRAIFRFNDTLDTYTLKPIAKGYQWITPQFAQDGIHNFFQNIGDVGNLVNDALQAKPRAAGIDTARLIFNTTFGVLGFIDVGTRMGLQRNNVDFGVTLGHWGVPSGPYVVLPFFGPSTVRDAIGKVPDAYTQPYPYMDNIPARNWMLGVNLIDTRASLFAAEKMVTGDRYSFIRNAFLQNREYKVKDGHVVDDF